MLRYKTIRSCLVKALLAASMPLGYIMAEDTASSPGLYQSRDPELVAILAEQEFYATSITSVRARYTDEATAERPLYDWAALGGSPPPDALIQRTVEWAQTGAPERRFLKVAEQGRDWSTEKVLAFDGTSLRTILRGAKDRDLRGYIDSHPGPEFRGEQTPLNLAGVVVWPFDMPLYMLATRGNAALAGEHDVDGVACVRVVVRQAPLYGGEQFGTVTADLDRRRRSLPRRLAVSLVDDDSQENPILTIIVKDFGQFALQPSGEACWVPTRAIVENYWRGADKRYHKMRTHRIQVEQIELNPQLSDSVFKPLFPEGTLVEDSVERKRFVQGPDGQQLPVASELAERAKALISNEQSGRPRVVARAPSSTVSAAAFALGVASTMAMCVGWILWRRAARS